MPEDIIIVILVVVAAVAGGPLGYFLLTRNKKDTIEDYEKKASSKINKANEEAKQIIDESRKKSLLMKERSIQQEKMQKEQYIRMENLVKSKEEQIKKKEETLGVHEKAADDETRELEWFKQRMAKLKDEMSDRLSSRSGITRERAKEEILAALNTDLALMKEDRLERLVR